MGGGAVDSIAQEISGHEKVALVAGATGLVGKELVRSLLSSPSNWTHIYGTARRLPDGDEEHQKHQQEGDHSRKYRFVQCDLLNRDQTMEKLGAIAGRVTHLFWVTWASQFPLDTAECCAQNRAMLRHALDSLLLLPGKLRHICLQTGTKHYVSLKAPSLLSGPYLEEEILHGEVGEETGHNFYYAMERLVMEQAGRGIISWSVHRPGLLFGASNRSYFNVIGSLGVYATLCRHLGMPFRFYGTKFCWEEHYIDMSDARLVAQQQIWWAATSSSPSHPLGNGEAFNAVYSAPFIWKQIWPALASKFGIEPEFDEMNWLSEEESRYAEIMRDKEQVWDEIVSANGLRKMKIDELANWGFLDSLFRFSGKLLAAPGKAQRLGFVPPFTYTNTESVLYWVDRIREMRFVP